VTHASSCTNNSQYTVIAHATQFAIGKTHITISHTPRHISGQKNNIPSNLTASLPIAFAVGTNSTIMLHVLLHTQLAHFSTFMQTPSSLKQDYMSAELLVKSF
jgi:hypothetical protein